MEQWQPPKGRCRLLISDLENYIHTEPKYVLHVNRTALRKTYKKKCQVGNELLILQGTNVIDPKLRGIFIIDGYRITATSSMVFAHKQAEKQDKEC